MKSADQLNSLSKEQLLSVEEICDRFERDLVCGSDGAIESYVQIAESAIQPLVHRELAALKTEVARRSETESTVRQASLTQRGAGNSQPSRDAILLDRFQLVDELGSGGTGTVWKARDTMLKRWVAIKIPCRNNNGDSARFIREARLSAQLHHPNIVHVHEVCEHDDGCFIVSELIEGESLEHRLRRCDLSIENKIELLVKIAEAIDYSHRIGVIHRDLKPHNILIDNDGEPHLADFGLAKAHGLDDSTVTLPGEVIGTPVYMSPEQARGSGESDGRTDIYAIGVILFRMLTGDLPFRGSVDSVVYQVIHVDPPSPRQWNADVPRDLETICLKCLDKDPARRFATARQLRDELDRFLKGEPIRSRPVSAWTQAWKWTQRNRKVAGFALVSATLLLAIAIGSSVAAVMLDRARQREKELRRAANLSEQIAQQARLEEKLAKSEAIAAQKNAEAEAARARLEAATNRQTAAFIQSIFEDSDPVAWVLSGKSNTGDAPPSMDNSFKDAALRIRTELKSQPRVQARLFDILGNACRGVGKFEDATRMLTEADRVRRAHADDYSSQDFQTESAHNLFYRAWLRHDLGERVEAEALYRSALKTTAGLGPSGDLVAANIQFHLGRLLAEQRRNAEAVPFFQNSVEIRERRLPSESRLITASKLGLMLCETDPDEIPALAKMSLVIHGQDWGSQIAIQYTRMMRLRHEKNFAPACALYRDVLDQLVEKLGAKHPLYILGLGDFAGMLWDAGNYRDAYPAIVEALAVGRKIAPRHHHVRHAMLRLAKEALSAGRIDEADAYFREVLRASSHSGRFDFDIHHGLLQTNLAMDRLAEAIEQSQLIIARVNEFPTEQAAWAYHTHARVLKLSGQNKLAESIDKQAWAAAVSVNTQSASALWLDRVSTVMSHHGDDKAAERLLRRALKIEESGRPANHPRIADRCASLATILLKTVAVDEARELLRRAYEIRRKQLPSDDKRIESTRKQLDRL